MNIKKVFSTALAVSVGLNGFSSQVVGASSTSARKPVIAVRRPALKDVRGCAPVKITVNDNFGYSVDFVARLDGGEEPCLLSIDGKLLRTASWPEIKLLLAGPVGSKVNIEVLTKYGEVKKIDLDRVPNVTQDERHISPVWFFEKLDDIDLRRFANWDSGDADKDLDIFAKASCGMAVSRAQSIPVLLEPSNLLERTALSAMLDMQKVGDLEAADRYLEIGLQELAKQENGRWLDAETLEIILANLAATGRSTDALQIGLAQLRDKKRDGMEAAISTWANYYLLQSLRSLVKFPAGRTNVEVQELAQYMRRKYTNRASHLRWLGRYFEKIGQPSEALLVYQSQIDGWRKANSSVTAKKVACDDLQALAAALYDKARLTAQKNNFADAQQCLASISSLYNSRYDLQQLRRLDQLPLYFPTPAQVDKAKIDLKIRKQICDVEEGNLVEINCDQDFKTLTQCTNAIKNLKRSEAQQASRVLLKLYLDQPQAVAAFQGYQFPSHGKHRPRSRLNLYLANLTIARKFADQKWFDLSNNILSKLHQSLDEKSLDKESIKVQSTLLAAEMAFNKVKAGQVNSLPPDFRSPFELRLLALTYHYAGDSERARTFIEQALTESGKRDTLGSRLLKIDAACIYASIADFDKAQAFYLKSQMSGTAFSDAYVATVVELATIYRRAGKSAQAISMMQDLHNTLAKVRNSNVKVSLENSQLFLAEMYLERKQWADALAAANAANKESRSSLSEAHIIAALAAEQLHDYATVAFNYFDAPAYVSEPGLPPFEPNQRGLFDKLALEAVTKPIAMHEEEMLEVCLKRSAEYRIEASKALILSKRALTLIKDNDSRKPDLLIKIADLEAQTVPRSTGQTANTIKANLDAAMLAQTNKLTNASHYWLKLACLEAQDNRVDSAVEHARHAFTLFSTTDPAAAHLQSLLPAYGLPYLLTKNGARDKASMLMEEAVERVMAVMGAGSTAHLSQMACQMQYHSQQADYDKVKKILSSILEYDFATNSGHPTDDKPGWGDDNLVLENNEQVLGFLRLIAVETVKGNNCSLAQDMLSQILTKQKSQLGENDKKLATTLRAIAHAYYLAEDYPAAYIAYNNLAEHLRKSETGRKASLAYNFEFEDVLQRLGKLSEIDTIQTERANDNKQTNESFKQSDRLREASKKLQLDAKIRAVKW